ncbi:uncharacterized protein LOC144769554 isoform X2 [Lissotriton helveticus]
MVVSMARAPALLPPPWTLLLLVPMMVSMGSAVTVIGWVGQPVTLPCSYTVRTARDVNPVCWGRGACPYSQCSDPLIQTDQRRVTWTKSIRYQLLGQLTRGDVSLTILNANEGDSGTYCCRIDVPGWFNDLKYNIELKMMRATTTTARTTTTTTPEPTTTSVTTTEATITLEPTTTAPSTTTASRTPTAEQTTTAATAITTAPTTIPTTAITKTAIPTITPTTPFTTLVVSTTADAQTLPTSIPTTAPTTTFATPVVSTTADARTVPTSIFRMRSHTTSIPTSTTATTMITTLTNTVKATPATTFITTYTTKTIPASTPPISHRAATTTPPSLSHTTAQTHESKITTITTAETTPTTIDRLLTIDETATITSQPSSGISTRPAAPNTAEDTTSSTTTPFKTPTTTRLLIHTTATATISAPVSATIAVTSTTPTDASTNASIINNSIPTTAQSARTLPEFTLTNTPKTRASIPAIIDSMTHKYKSTTKLTDASTPTHSRTVGSPYMDSTGRFPTTANISTLMSVNSERQPAPTGQHTMQPMKPAIVDAETPVSKSDVSLSGNEMKREGSSALSSASLIAVVCGCVGFCALILLFGLRVRSKLWNKYHLNKTERLWADGRPVELFNRTFKDGEEPENIFSL